MWAQSSPPPSPCPCQSSGWSGLQFLREEGKKGQMEQNPGLGRRGYRSDPPGAELKEEEGHRKQVYSLEVGLIVCPIHPFPDSFRISEAYPGE